MSEDRASGFSSRTIAALTAATACALPFGIAFAHHSLNMFDMETTIVVEGRVTDFDYVNPHGWIIVDTTDEQGESVTWEVETISALIMGRRGITPDSLSEGEWVRIEMHPARNPDRLMANGEIVHKLDGGTLAVGFQNGNPELETAAAPAVAAVTDGLSGRWRAESRLRDVIDLPILNEWPMTAAARAALDAYDGSQNPWVECVPYSPPVVMFAPLTMDIVVSDTEVRLSTGVEDGDRIVYMDGREHPPGSSRYNAGHSVGHWEGDTLIIDTTNFTARDLGHAFGIPSGEGKHLIERLTLNEAGTHIDYSYEVVDPEFLSDTVTGTTRLQYRPDLELDIFDCDAESARRFLDVF